MLMQGRGQVPDCTTSPVTADRCLQLQDGQQDPVPANGDIQAQVIIMSSCKVPVLIKFTQATAPAYRHVV
jgi:hypothetical protein